MERIAVKEREQLVVPDELAVKQELALIAPSEMQASPVKDPELDAKAEEYAAMLIGFDLQDVKQREDRKAAVEAMALDTQIKAAKQSEMLKQPVKQLYERSEDGGTVANALIDLKMQVEDLDPGKVDLEAGWTTRLIGMIPGIGTPLKRYFTRFEQAQTVINAIIRSLQDGKGQLERDNRTLLEDQKHMREMTVKLEKTITLGRAIDEKLSYKLERDVALQDEQKMKFIQEELLFPLRQRIVDLQQALAVNQQGVLAIEIIIRNNKELIRGVHRALSVTVSSLEVAVTVALALANQKIVLDKIEAVNKTTSDLIANTAARLRTQGAAIHKQASSTQLDMEALKSAFNDIYAAMDDISRFRTEALPKMASTILELDKMTAKGEETIKKLEKGNEARPSISIEWI